MCAQLYFTLIVGANGEAGLPLVGAYLAMILASFYAFFNPVRSNGINALQSNAAQVALVGGGAMQLMAGGVGTPFLILFALQAFDTFVSCANFFSGNS